MSNTREENLGYLLGLVAVVAFAVTLPATRAAVRAFDPVFVGLGRAVGAAVLAGAFLFLTRQRLPSREQSKNLVVVAAGVVVGFPLLTAWAMRHVDASHGGVVLGILPLATPGAGALFYRERPSPRFWLCALIGATLVVGYALSQSSGALQWTDLALFGAIVSAGIGYAEGARLSKNLGGLQVISWALVFSAPVLLVPVLVFAPATVDLPLESWIGLVYVTVISQFLGFLPWYQGLALGGIAKVSQIQLLQPFLTILASALLLGESGDVVTWAVAILVVAVVAVGKTAPVTRLESNPLLQPAGARGRRLNGALGISQRGESHE